LEIPEGVRGHLDIPEGDLEDESDDIEDENPFHDVGPLKHAAWGRLEDRLLRKLDLNGGGIKTEVDDFFGKMHGKNY
jgi:hypothetical protein